MTGHSRVRLLRLAGSVWLVQGALMLMQLGFAAFTGRVYSEADFGAYTAALVSIGLAGLVAVAGFAKASARRVDDSVIGDRRLATGALLVGGITALIVIPLSPFLAGLWGVAGASRMIAALCLSLPFAAFAGVVSGIMRRQLKIKQLNVVVFVSGVSALGTALIVVIATRMPLALVVMPVAMQVFMALGLAVLAGQRSRPTRHLAGVGADLRFAGQSSANSILVYGSWTLSLIALGRAAGPGILGSWNRATVFTSVPVESVTTSWNTVMFSLFRGDKAGTQGRRVMWTDLAAAACFGVLPVAAVTAPAVPVVIGMLLGSGWETTQQMAVWLWLAAWVMAVATILLAPIEATGNFSVLWASQVARALILVAAAALLLGTGDWRVLAVAMLVSAVGVLVVTFMWGHRADLLDGHYLFPRLSLCVVLAVVFGAVGFLVDRVSSPWITVLVCSVIAACYGVGLFAARQRVGFLRRLWVSRRSHQD